MKRSKKKDILTTSTDMIKVPTTKQICEKHMASTRLMCKQYVSRRAFFSRGFLLGKINVKNNVKNNSK